MMVLSKDNLTDYLKTKMPELDYSRPLNISAVGEGDAEDDGDGYINFVFRVSDGNRKLILKQGLRTARVAGFDDLSEDRIRLEYQSMQIRSVIVPEYMPKMYFYDAENYIFATEDVSYLQIARFQLNKSVQFPNLAKDAATFLAKSHFYTSDYYMETRAFRDLAVHFRNHRMREVFDTMLFVFNRPGFDGPNSLNEEYAPYVSDIVYDPKLVLERYKLRDLYMFKEEALIHTDFHTSNIFAGPDAMKVIDMEYTYCGPMALDLGYLQGSLISQYVCAAFRPYDNEEDRRAFQNYMLTTMAEFYNVYRQVFSQCWDQDAKPIYQGVDGLQDSIMQGLLHDMIGFCGTSNMFRAPSNVGFPEYDIIKDPIQRRHAVVLSMLMDRHMILHRNEYTDVTAWLSDMVAIEQIYKKKYC